jgi:streptogramin lyase
MQRGSLVRTASAGVGLLAACAAVLALTCGVASAAVPGAVTEFSAGISPNSGPLNIAAGPDGNLWFTEIAGNAIGQITPSGVATEFDTGLSSAAGVYGLAAGPDGSLWFAEQNRSQIGRISTAGAISELSNGISPVAAPNQVAVGSDGNIWFTEASTTEPAIGRITPAGVVTEFPITAHSAPHGITLGSDGNIWFTEASGAIGRITPSGVLTEFHTGITALSQPFGIAAGPDGNIWIAEDVASQIARLTLPIPPDPPVIQPVVTPITTPMTTPTPPGILLAKKCKVPNLVRHTLTAAKAALAKAHCALGKITRPKHAMASKLRVAHQTIKPGAHTARRIAFTLAVPPQPKHKSKHAAKHKH